MFFSKKNIFLLSALSVVNLASIYVISSSCSSTTDSKSGTSETRTNPQKPNSKNEGSQQDNENQNTQGQDDSSSSSQTAKKPNPTNEKDGENSSGAEKQQDNSKFLEVLPGAYFTDNVESNFKNIIFNKELAKQYLPSEFEKNSENFLNSWDEKLIKKILLGYSIQEKPTITEANDEKGTARIQCSLSRGNEVKEIDYIYDEFLTTKQKEINESPEIQNIINHLDNYKFFDWQIVLDLEKNNSYNINDYKDKTVKELLTNLQFDDESTKLKKVLLENENKIEGLNEKVELFEHYNDPNTFLSFISIKNNKQEKSSKIRLIITHFLNSPEIINKKQLWSSIFEKMLMTKEEEIGSLLATDMNVEKVWRDIFKAGAKETKVSLLKTGELSYFALIKFLDIFNANDSIGSLDIALEMKIVKDDKIVDVEEKVLTLYGFKAINRI